MARPSARYGEPGAKCTVSYERKTNSDMYIIPKVIQAYNEKVNPDLMVRGLNITCNNLTENTGIYQMNLLDTEEVQKIDKNNKIQKAVVEIKKRYGKNAVLKGMNFEEAATTKERNQQIGGHKDGGQA